METGTGVLVSPVDTRTDPFNADSDGWSDGAEVAAGSDPNDAGSIPAEVPALTGLGVALFLLTLPLALRRARNPKRSPR